jgi:long-chain acyl-CoA synthetase
MPSTPPIRTHLSSLVQEYIRYSSDTAVVTRAGLRRHATSYCELAHLTGRFAGYLLSQGIAKGDRVVICAPNSAPWIAAFFGCVLRGVVVAPLDVNGSLDFTRRVITDTRPKLVVAARELSESFRDVPFLAVEDFDATLPPAGDTSPATGLSEDDPLQIVFTSGTTAEPKGIVHTHRNVLASVRPIETEMGKYRRYERVFHPLRFLHTLPLSHVFGQFMGLWLPPLLGAALHFPPRLVAQELIETISAERISVVAAVPRVLDLLRRSLLEQNPDLPQRLEVARTQTVWRKWWTFRDIHSAFGLKFWAFVCGGASLDYELEQFWLRLGFAVIQGYGMTETTALVSLNHPFKAASGSLGEVMPGREVRLSPDGEILVKGETIAGSTWEHGVAVARESEWLATGDVGRMDAAGRLRFVGRKKDVIVTSSGLNIYPEDVEAELNREPGITACVFGVEADAGPEAGAAVIAGSREQAAVAIERANARLAEYQRVRQWMVWPEPDFPRTSNGKLLRRSVADDYVRRISGSDAAVAAPDEDMVSRLIEQASQRPGPFADVMPLDSLLDSLGRLALAAAVEERFGVVIRDDEWPSLSTVRQLRQRLLDTATSRHPGARPTAVSPGEASADSQIYPRWPWTWWQQAIRAVFLETIMRPVCWFLAAPRIERATPLASDGPVLIVANHVSSYDAGLILYALPRPMRRRVAVAMSGEFVLNFRKARGLGNPFLNALGPAAYFLMTALFNVFPLPQKSSFRKSFSHAAAAMDHGYHVLVFPEGIRSEDGIMAPFKAGAGLLWTQLGCPALPVFLEGLGEMKQRRSRWFRSGKLTVRIGRLLRRPESMDGVAATRLLEQSVSELAVE